MNNHRKILELSVNSVGFGVAGKRLRLKYGQLIYDNTGYDEEDEEEEKRRTISVEEEKEKAEDNEKEEEERNEEDQGEVGEKEEE